ncbi:MAG: ferritin-like domain-containing protein [Bdellovibrionota bacterium]
MQDTFIAPMTGKIPRDYEANPDVNFMNENKSNYLNKILRGEISAVEAYEQVIPTFKDKTDRLRLTEIRDEHDRIVIKLKALVEHSMFAADESSGSWGTIVTTIVGAAKLVSNTISLVTLMEGEEHGLRLYKEALEYNLTEEEHELIVEDIMPLLQKHIASLEYMIKHQNDSIVHKE